MTPLPERFAEYVAKLRELGESPSMARYPGLPEHPWYDAQTIPLARDLERAAAQIRAEYERCDPALFVPEREPIARDGAWDVLLLYERGRRHDARLAALPAIRTVIEANRAVRTLAGLVYFSRLAPNTRVAAHTGPTNMRIRVHLGIDVPPHCGIRAGGIAATWETGRCIAFDDSFPHDVWNESEGARIVLVADVWHPDLSDDEVQLLDGFHRYIEYAAAGLQRYWSMNTGVNAPAPRPLVAARYALLALVCGAALIYFTWRCGVVDPRHPVFGWLVVTTEAVGFARTLLFLLSAVRLAHRARPAATAGLRADVFVTTADERSAIRMKRGYSMTAIAP